MRCNDLSYPSDALRKDSKDDIYHIYSIFTAVSPSAVNTTEVRGLR